MARAGLNQADLADALGVAQQTVSKWIIGETAPRRRHLPRIETLLDLPRGTMATLLFASDDMPIDLPKPSRPVPTIAALRRKLSALSTEELARVEAYVDGVFDSRQ